MAYKEVVVKKPLLLRVLPYASVAVFLLIWELLVSSGLVPEVLLASPSKVFSVFIDKLTDPNPDGAVLAVHAWTSLLEAFIGYSLSLLVGIPLGLAMGWF